MNGNQNGYLCVNSNTVIIISPIIRCKLHNNFNEHSRHKLFLFNNNTKYWFIINIKMKIQCIPKSLTTSSRLFHVTNMWCYIDLAKPKSRARLFFFTARLKDTTPCPSQDYNLGHPTWSPLHWPLDYWTELWHWRAHGTLDHTC